MNKDAIIAKIKEVSLFADLKDNQSSLIKLSEMLHLKHFKKGSTIISEGDDGVEMFILYTGIAEIRKNTMDNDFYVVTLLNSDKHAFFGEMAMIEKDKRSASVVAKTDCDVLVLNELQFLELGNTDPKIGLLVTRRISQIMGQRLRKGNQDLITLFEALVGEIEEKT